ncbi:MAG: sigma-70 family RNA polymerase sigma factor [Alphaproteobacteria bacterium]|nr:sigma-70 family RNA polymerase sigma factor [Alphaproteobacteria bacterium]
MTENLDDTDESLARRLKNGDHQAFSTLVRRHSDMYYRAAYRILQNKEDAEDMVQAAFLKLWDKPALWKDGKGATFKTWFYKIVMNQCLDFKRKTKSVVRIEGIENMVSYGSDAEQEMTMSEEQRRVENAISLLPDKQKMAIGLCYDDALKQKEAAHIMGVSLKAFESLLGRAKQNLKGTLTREGLIDKKGGRYAR